MWNFCRNNLTLVACLITVPALFFALSQHQSAGESTLPVPISPYDDRILQLDREALDEAYRNQIVHVFEVWMKDETGQPSRAVVGANRARRAYINGMVEIEKRSQKNPAPR